MHEALVQPVSSATSPVAVVTGASRGIGLATLKALGRAGYFVVGTATSADGTEGIASILEAEGLAGDTRILDIADVPSVSNFCKWLLAEHQAPEVLVNNAGITRDNLAMVMKEEEWDAVIGTNLSGTFRVVQGLLRPMIKRRSGRIINISSVVAGMGNPGQVNYCAAKAGLEGLTRSLAREIASRKVTVNAIAPGFIDTDMTDKLDDSVREAMLARIPLGEMGQAEDIARAVLFLAGEGGRYITGQVLAVNGGLDM